MSNEQVPLSQEVFGPYLVNERIGVGGMATVHRAKERGIEGFERIVALKRLLPHLAEDATFVKSFVREAKLASLLQHANVVQLYELGRVGTTYFISMEYIDGRDVRRILRQARKVTGPPTINVTLSLLIQLCDALDYAHTRTDEDGTPLGIVHRDVSPSNLLVTRSGHLKVIDFGIAKAQSQQLRTQTGRVKGKLAYMAPEAISGKELDARSDIFSAGVIAHELLTARPLFASKNEYQTLIKVQRGDVVPPSTFNQAVPPELDAIVARALARDPDQRFYHASQMRDELHGVRIKYQLSATNREVSSWCEWAFSLEAPANNFGGPMNTDSLSAWNTPSRSSVANLPLRAPTADTPATGPVPVVPSGTPASHAQMSAQAAQHDEDDAAEVAWGGGAEHDSGAPVVLDDVPDVSSKFPAIPAGLTASAAHAAAGGLSHELTPARRTMMGPPGAQQHGRPQSQQPVHWPHGSSEDALPPSQRTRARTSSGYTPMPVAPIEDTTRNPLLSPHEASSFGSSIVGQGTGQGGQDRRKAPLLLVGVGAMVALLAVIAFLLVGRGGKPAATTPTPPAVAEVGKLKIFVEPTDSVIRIAGFDPQTGSPWEVELEPGQHQVEIKRDGYKTYRVELELSANETQTLRVVLEEGGNAHLATLILSSTPTGLTAVLDGRPLEQKTPLRMEVSPGAHVVTLLQDGQEMWRQEFMAQANTSHEFNPSMSESKRREREERARQVVADRRPSRPAPAATPRPSVGSPAAAADDDDLPVAVASIDAAMPVAPLPAPVAPPIAAPTRPTPAPAPVAAPTKPAAPAATPLISPKQVKRLSGSAPTIQTTMRATDKAPPNAAVKMCIDAKGSVTSVKVLSKIGDDIREKIERAFGDWKYTPYKAPNGVASPACFVTSFALK
jgi:serine/threonine protein kinase